MKSSHVKERVLSHCTFQSFPTNLLLRTTNLQCDLVQAGLSDSLWKPVLSYNQMYLCNFTNQWHVGKDKAIKQCGATLFSDMLGQRFPNAEEHDGVQWLLLLINMTNYFSNFHDFKEYLTLASNCCCYIYISLFFGMPPFHSEHLPGVVGLQLPSPLTGNCSSTSGGRHIGYSLSSSTLISG